MPKSSRNQTKTNRHQNSTEPWWQTHHQQSSRSKFELYVKSQEVETVLTNLKDLKSVSNQARREWLEENEPVVMDMLEQFLDDSVSTMNGFQLDRESMELSMKLVTDLREATALLQSLYADDTPAVG